MKQKLFSILALLLVAATGAWADTTVTWTASDMSGLYISFDDGSASNNTIKGITATASAGGNGNWDKSTISAMAASNTITFTSSVGNIKSIAIKAESISVNPQGGWTLSDENKKLSWSGEASSTVSLTLSAWDGINNISEIVFTIESPTYSVTMAEGTEDAGNWKVKVGEGEAKAFPVEGLNGGETVTVTYSGEKKVKSVKAVKKAAVASSVSFTVKRVGVSNYNLTDGTYTVAPGTTWQQFIESGDAPACLSIGTSGTYSGKVCHDMNNSLQECGGTFIANVADKKRVKASDAIIDGATYGCSHYLGYQDHD